MRPPELKDEISYALVDFYCVLMAKHRRFKRETKERRFKGSNLTFIITPSEFILAKDQMR